MAEKVFCDSCDEEIVERPVQKLWTEGQTPCEAIAVTCKRCEDEVKVKYKVPKPK